MITVLGTVADIIYSHKIILLILHTANVCQNVMN